MYTFQLTNKPSQTSVLPPSVSKKIQGDSLQDIQHILVGKILDTPPLPSGSTETLTYEMKKIKFKKEVTSSFTVTLKGDHNFQITMNPALRKKKIYNSQTDRWESPSSKKLAAVISRLTPKWLASLTQKRRVPTEEERTQSKEQKIILGRFYGGEIQRGSTYKVSQNSSYSFSILLDSQGYGHLVQTDRTKGSPSYQRYSFRDKRWEPIKVGSLPSSPPSQNKLASKNPRSETRNQKPETRNQRPSTPPKGTPVRKKARPQVRQQKGTSSLPPTGLKDPQIQKRQKEAREERFKKQQSDKQLLADYDLYDKNGKLISDTSHLNTPIGEDGEGNTIRKPLNRKEFRCIKKKNS